MIECSKNGYADYLKEAGLRVCESNGVTWYQYNGFLIPAYLPHVMPPITVKAAKAALAQSGALFARWTSEFDTCSTGDWWYVVRDGGYSVAELSSNTRSKVTRGLKKLEVRTVPSEKILQDGYIICEKAILRYGSTTFLPDRGAFERRISAAGKHGDTVEYCGVYYGEQLVGFSENYLQDGGVFWESIWYDPEYMGHYSSYALTHFMLDRYLSQLGMRYVSDGSRSLYHETNVQLFFCEKFGFRHARAKLCVQYTPVFSLLVRLLFPFRKVVAKASRRLDSTFARKIDGLLEQESVRRSF